MPDDFFTWVMILGPLFAAVLVGIALLWRWNRRPFD
jgi:hypothetical protein